jgi:hypothetical protein
MTGLPGGEAIQVNAFGFGIEVYVERIEGDIHVPAKSLDRAVEALLIRCIAFWKKAGVGEDCRPGPECLEAEKFDEAKHGRFYPFALVFSNRWRGCEEGHGEWDELVIAPLKRDSPDSGIYITPNQPISCM